MDSNDRYTIPEAIGNRFCKEPVIPSIGRLPIVIQHALYILLSLIFTTVYLNV